MQEGRHYANAPIVDAVIDMRVQFSAEPPSVEALEKFAKNYSDRFQTLTHIQTVRIDVGVGADGEVSETQKPTNVKGVRLEGTERILILKPTGFTYGHRPPYSRWELFKREAQALWNDYCNIFQPESVSRHAVRYINRIVVPEAQVEADKYFSLHPNIPIGIPEAVVGMLMQLRFEFSDAPGVGCIVNLGLTDAAQDEGLAFLLDIDVFGTINVAPRRSDLWERLEFLRGVKNRMFEASITDKARELFK